MTPPMTQTDEREIEKIKTRQYECFIEDHESKPWTPGQCAGYAGHSVHLMRCKRRDGHGIGALFCRQHAKHEGDDMADTPTREELADRICRDVADLPDRTSPDDQPEMMLVTGDELHGIVMNALEAVTLPPAAAGGGWRPIETAPKDGTSLLLNQPGDDPEATVGCWCDAIDDVASQFGAPPGWYDALGPIEPTHWQPLPAPPPHPDMEK